PPPSATLFPYTTLFRSCRDCGMTPFPPCEYDTLLAVSMCDEERIKRHAGGEKSVGNAGMSASRCDSGVGMVDEGYCILSMGFVRLEEHTSELQSQSNLV